MLHFYILRIEERCTGEKNLKFPTGLKSVHSVPKFHGLPMMVRNSNELHRKLAAFLYSSIRRETTALESGRSEGSLLWHF